MTIAGVREARVAPHAASIDPSPEPAPGAPAAGDAPSPFAAMLHGLGREMQHGEAVMRGALSAGGAGQTLEPSQLIALQAGVYRYSEAVDLASRLVDRATNGVKTVVQGQ
jgi:hypothetical protein